MEVEEEEEEGDGGILRAVLQACHSISMAKIDLLKKEIDSAA